MTNKLVKQSATTAWDAGAISAITQSGDLRAQFKLVGGSAGLVVGLSNAVSTPAYAAVQHGFLAQTGKPIQVIESGVIVAASPEVFAADVVATIYRFGTAVFYSIGDWAYLSTSASTGAKVLQSVLYAQNDAVDEPSITLYAADLSQAALSETITFSDEYGFEDTIFGGLTEIITLTSSGGGDVAILAGIEEFITFLDECGGQSEIMAGMESTIRITDGAGTSGDALLQYATNIATGAVTRYANFEFIGFCRIGMDTYGIRRDGLYRIAGASDDKAPIDALIDMAAESLGTTQGKRIGNIFMGLDTDGVVSARLTTDEGAELPRPAYQRRKEFRADFGRGASSRFWRLRVEINGASSAKLDNIEWVAASTGRRS